MKKYGGRMNRKFFVAASVLASLILVSSALASDIIQRSAHFYAQAGVSDSPVKVIRATGDITQRVKSPGTRNFGDFTAVITGKFKPLDPSLTKTFTVSAILRDFSGCVFNDEGQSVKCDGPGRLIVTGTMLRYMATDVDVHIEVNGESVKFQVTKLVDGQTEILIDWIDITMVKYRYEIK